jgi:hypothetical protein
MNINYSLLHELINNPEDYLYKEYELLYNNIIYKDSLNIYKKN